MEVTINTLDDGPHKPGALVFDLRDHNRRWKMEVRYDGETYHVYLFALDDEGTPKWTRLAADGGAKPATARTAARRFWREIAMRESY